MIQPSCPAFVIHGADDFRTRLIKTLDENHFSVTIGEDSADAVSKIEQRQFHVILVELNLQTKVGMKTVDFLSAHRDRVPCGVIILGEPDPALRTFAPWANETLLKPVDPQYVAARARTYCRC